MSGHFWLCKKTEEQVLWSLTAAYIEERRLLMMLAGNYGENGRVAEGRGWKIRVRKS